MPEDKKVVSVGVTMAPIVESLKNVKVNEIVQLKLITGLNTYDIVYKNGDLTVEVGPDRTIVFTEPGIYRPWVLNQTFLHESYNINVSE